MKLNLLVDLLMELILKILVSKLLKVIDTEKLLNKKNLE